MKMNRNEKSMTKDSFFAGSLVLASLLWLGAGAAHEALAFHDVAVVTPVGATLAHASMVADTPRS
jgi:hypothetical protein